MVKDIWNSFQEMMTILLKDPVPDIHLDIPALARFEHNWGYRESDKKNYTVHSERFYQLFSARYTCKSLPPYMIKLVDHFLDLMDNYRFLWQDFSLRQESMPIMNITHSTIIIPQDIVVRESLTQSLPSVKQFGLEFFMRSLCRRHLKCFMKNQTEVTVKS